jgi:tellurite resistance protein TerC
MDITTTTWLVTLAGLSLLIAFDLVLAFRRPHAVSMREAGLWTGFYVALAVAFGIYLGLRYGSQSGGEFFAGWLTEYSLSVDNLFVFVIILSRFRVPRENQQFLLLIGIILALVMRAGFIALGAAAIEQFSWVFYLFGGFLIWTAWKLATHRDEEPEEYQENRVVRWMRSVVHTTPDYHGNHLRVRIDGRKAWTPMIIVMVAIGTTDLLFALDSIPAIFGLTQEPYIVFTANAFALMGLRQLYFLLGGLLDRLVYLSVGLSVILGFIGVKLVLHALHENELPFINGGEHVSWAPEIPTLWSLGVIVVTLIITTVASLAQQRRPAA